MKFLVNYYTIRIALTVLISIILIILFKFVLKKNTKKVKIIKLLIVVILYVAIWNIPFEKWLIKFENVEDAFEYHYPKGKIIKKYIYDDYAYIFYSNDGPVNFIYYIKNNGWKFDNDFTMGNGRLKVFDGYSILINEIKGKGIVGIAIVYPEIINKNASITDSLSTSFDRIIYNDGSNWTMYAHIAIINGMIDNDYTLNINGKEYKPFK